MNAKPLILTSVAAILVVSAVAGLKIRSNKQQAAAQASMVMPPATVSSATAEKQVWPNAIVAVASLTSSQGITVKTELDGIVAEIAARSGAAVAAGELLVRLDTSAEEAQLSGLEAGATLAELTLKRARELRSTGTNTPADLDAAEASATQAQSAVNALKVTIAKKHIRAPFSGRLGIVKVYAGQFLSKGDSLVALESLDPIHADFSLPQQELSRVKEGQPVRLHLDVWAGRDFAATITAISPRVADGTRMVDLRATLPNPDGALRPGMYANLEVALPATPDAVVIPATAVVRNPYGETVYVIENNIATQRFIKTAASRGDLVLVASGLKAGDIVVTSGQLKLRNGSPVKVDNTATPHANPAPKPAES